MKTIKQAADYIRDGAQSSYGTNGYGLWKVALHSGEPIGICGLVKRDYLDDVDLGFGYLPEYQGQGYGYEAAKAVVDHATLSLGIGKLVAITTEQNIGSISLLSKLEFKPEGTVIYPGTEEELLLFNRIS